MLRITLIEIMLFLAPFAAYFIWRAVRRPRVVGEEPPAPYQMLALTGATLAVLAMVAFALISAQSNSGEGVFVPPSLEDGGISPGRIEPQEPERGGGEPAATRL